MGNTWCDSLRTDFNMGAAELYSRLKNEPIPLTSKVEIALRRYGWTGERRKESASILAKMQEDGYQLFPAAVTLIEQFYKLIFPCKSSDSKCGAHLLFVFEPYVEADEAFSIHYNELCVPFGELRSFDLYSNSIPKGTWEKIEKSPTGYASWDLYLGLSGRVYWYCVDATSGGVYADSLLDFFASQFGFIENTYLKDGTREEYDDSDFIQEIEAKRLEGTYIPKWHMQNQGDRHNGG